MESRFLHGNSSALRINLQKKEQTQLDNRHVDN